MSTDTAKSWNRYLPPALRSWRNAGIILPFAILFVTLSITSGPFLRKTNLLNILDQQSAILIIAAAGALILVSGAIDLSVGATYALAGCVSAQYAIKHSVLSAVIVGLILGLLVGIVNGIIVAIFKINSLIATLAMFLLSADWAQRLQKVISLC